MHQRVVPGSLTVLFKSSVDYRTLVCGCRIAIYRPRRKKGRIKCDAEKRHSVVGEQKIEKKAGDVLRFDSNGDKNILSTPSVTNGLLSTRDPLLPDSATITQLSLLDEPDAAAAGQSDGRTSGHDSLVTISFTRCQGTTGRHGSWIQRSPSHTQRESSNAKFYCQWQERVVVICFGLLACMIFTQLITKPTTLGQPPASHRQATGKLISHVYETHFIETFSFYLPAISILFPSLPLNKQINVIESVKANNRTKVGQSQQLHERTPRPHVVTDSFPPRPRPVRTTSSSLPKMERSSGGSIPPTTIVFCGESISIFETFLVSFLF